ncbi:hypothetical protein D3C71_1029590 [compost metagenome]
MKIVTHESLPAICISTKYDREMRNRAKFVRVLVPLSYCVNEANKWISPRIIGRCWMSDILINEQLIILGNVDVPLNNDNTMKLLKVFGEAGYMPTVSQEINVQTGQSVNRMSLVNGVDITIAFNTDRISFIRNPNPTKPVAQDFIELARLFTDKLAQEFNLKANRCVLSQERFMAECSEEKMNSTAAVFLNKNHQEGEDAFEWFTRQSIAYSDAGEKLLKVMEVGRVQGKIILNSVLTEFDRVRVKAEVGTDFHNRENRYDLKEISALTLRLGALHSDLMANLVKAHHES